MRPHGMANGGTLGETQAGGYFFDSFFLFLYIKKV
jgi:hypothetical protein